MRYIDINTIKEHYAHMHEAQLIQIAQTDGHILKPEVFDVLKTEFVKRDMDLTPVDDALQKKKLLHEAAIEKIRTSTQDTFNEAVLQYATDEKVNGTGRTEIIAGLMERGMDETAAAALESSVKNTLAEAIKKYSKRAQVAAAVCLLGVFINLMSFTSAMVSGGTYYIFGGIIFFSALTYFHAKSEKSKHIQMLKTIEERETLPGT